MSKDSVQEGINDSESCQSPLLEKCDKPWCEVKSHRRQWMHWAVHVVLAVALGTSIFLQYISRSNPVERFSSVQDVRPDEGRIYLSSVFIPFEATLPILKKNPFSPQHSGTPPTPSPKPPPVATKSGVTTRQHPTGKAHPTRKTRFSGNPSFQSATSAPPRTNTPVWVSPPRATSKTRPNTSSPRKSTTTCTACT